VKYIVVEDEGSIIFSVGGTNCYSIEALRLMCDISDEEEMLIRLKYGSNSDEAIEIMYNWEWDNYYNDYEDYCDYYDDHYEHSKIEEAILKKSRNK
jgi:hypothetical protein